MASFRRMSTQSIKVDYIIKSNSANAANSLKTTLAAANPASVHAAVTTAINNSPNKAAITSAVGNITVDSLTAPSVVVAPTTATAATTTGGTSVTTGGTTS